MKVRCKMLLVSVTQHAYAGNKPQRTFKFQTSYDDTTPEDLRFYDATPNGSFEITVNNPAVLESYKLGEYYYFDSFPAVPAELTDGA